MAVLRATSLCLLLGLLSLPAIGAVPQSCIQLPERNTACPHLLYKKSSQAIAPLNVPANGLICLCLSDLNGLLKEARNPVEKAQQQWQLSQLQRRFALNQAQLVQLIRE